MGPTLAQCRLTINLFVTFLQRTPPNPRSDKVVDFQEINAPQLAKSMKTSIAFVLFSVLSLNAEIFVGPTSATNRLVINSNEAIIVYANMWRPDATGEEEFTLVTTSATNSFAFSESPYGSHMYMPVGICGLAEIVATNAAMLSFKRLKGDLLKSVLLPRGKFVSIDVPPGKTFRMFGITGDTRLTVSKNEKTATCLVSHTLSAMPELIGPVNIKIEYDDWRSSRECGLVSYFLTEDFLSMPETGLLDGPTGAFELKVSKSLDLTNWYPILIVPTSADQKQFYKLQITK